MIDGGAKALALAVPVQLDPPDTHVNQALLTNLSGFTCQVDNGGGNISILAPWTVNYFPLNPGASIILKPIAQLAGASTDNVLRVSWAVDSETINGSYPQTLTSQAIAALVQGTVTTAISGTAQTLSSGRQVLTATQTTYPTGSQVISGLVASDQAIMLALTSGTGNDWVHVTGVTGNQSGILYCSGDVATVQSPLIVPIYGPEDSSVTVSYGGPGVNGPPRMAAFAFPFIPPPTPVPIRSTAYQSSAGSGTLLGYPLEGSAGNAFRILELSFGFSTSNGPVLALLQAPYPIVGAAILNLVAVTSDRVTHRFTDPSGKLILSGNSLSTGPVLQLSTTSSPGAIAAWCNVVYQQLV